MMPILVFTKQLYMNSVQFVMISVWYDDNSPCEYTACSRILTSTGILAYDSLSLSLSLSLIVCVCVCVCVHLHLTNFLPIHTHTATSWEVTHTHMHVFWKYTSTHLGPFKMMHFIKACIHNMHYLYTQNMYVFLYKNKRARTSEKKQRLCIARILSQVYIQSPRSSNHNDD